MYANNDKKREDVCLSHGISKRIEFFFYYLSFSSRDIYFSENFFQTKIEKDYCSNISEKVLASISINQCPFH